MITANLFVDAVLALPLVAGGVEPQAPQVTFEAPTMYVVGLPYEVEVTIEASAEGGSAAAWWLTPAGFLIDDEPAQRRDGDALVPLAPGTSLTVKFDLAPFIGANEDFNLSFAQVAYDGAPIAVSYFRAVETEGEGALNFMEAPAEQLDDFLVVLQTNRGTMVAEFWPDVAPNHVRNFLDLSATGFYDGTLFHRVIPGFMIQGGDPYTKDPAQAARWGTGNGPRQLQAEFNDRKHVAGVLSTARSADPNSGSCQFFVMHSTATHLDNQYTAFGKLTRGLDVVEKIVNTPRSRDGRDRPNTPQQIVRAIVVHKN